MKELPPGTLLGPAPCHDCHVPLFMVRGLLGECRWGERRFTRIKGEAFVTLAPHQCTARTPVALPPGVFDNVMQAHADLRR